jgi:Fe-S cluster assembly iron-binding protein IscA
MLSVSERAAGLLRESLEASNTEETQVLRLVRMAEGLGLAVDEEREGDQVVEHEDKKVLVIEPAISQALDGATIDAVQTPEGERLTIQRPEAPPAG